MYICICVYMYIYMSIYIYVYIYICHVQYSSIRLGGLELHNFEPSFTSSLQTAMGQKLMVKLYQDVPIGGLLGRCFINFFDTYFAVSEEMGFPKAGWFQMENPHITWMMNWATQMENHHIDTLKPFVSKSPSYVAASKNPGRRVTYIVSSPS